MGTQEQGASNTDAVWEESTSVQRVSHLNIHNLCFVYPPLLLFLVICPQAQMRGVGGGRRGGRGRGVVITENNNNKIISSSPPLFFISTCTLAQTFPWISFPNTLIRKYTFFPAVSWLREQRQHNIYIFNRTSNSTSLNCRCPCPYQ